MHGHNAHLGKAQPRIGTTTHQLCRCGQDPFNQFYCLGYSMEMPQARDQARLPRDQRHYRVQGRRETDNGRPGSLPGDPSSRGRAMPRVGGRMQAVLSSRLATSLAAQPRGTETSPLPLPQRQQRRHGTWAAKWRPQTMSQPGWEARGEIRWSRQGAKAWAGRAANRTTLGSGPGPDPTGAHGPPAPPGSSVPGPLASASTRPVGPPRTPATAPPRVTAPLPSRASDAPASPGRTSVLVIRCRPSFTTAKLPLPSVPSMS